MKKYFKIALVLSLTFGTAYAFNVQATENNPQSTQKTSTNIKDNSATITEESTDGLVKSIHKFTKNTDNTTWQHVTSDVIKNKKSGSTLIPQSHVLTNFVSNNKVCSPQPEIGSCAKKSKVTAYLTADNTQLIYQSFYNDRLTSKTQWLRNSNMQLTEQRSFTYYANGQIKRYERLYGGKKLSTSYLSFNKSYVRNNDTKGRVNSIYNYENSLIWNGNATNILTSATTYSYYSNNKVKQRNTVNRSAKYNRITRKQFQSYYSNGKRSKLIRYSFNTNGTRNARLEYKYNKQGQLKSNRYGAAYKRYTSYRNNKVVKSTKVNYTAAGKIRR